MMLNHVVEPLITEAAARFDPQIPNLRTPFGVGYTGVLQALVLWRETGLAQRRTAGRGADTGRPDSSSADRGVRGDHRHGPGRGDRLPAAADQHHGPRQLLSLRTEMWTGPPDRR